MYYTIGSIVYDEHTKSYSVERDATAQGFVFKSEENYMEHPELPCYVPELTDTIYTRQDFLDIAKKNRNLADFLFDMVDWQSPETLLDELLQCDVVREEGDTYDFASFE
jgi:hypothetical protein